MAVFASRQIAVPDPGITITITGGDSTAGYVTIDGTKYTEGTVTVPVGTTMVVTAYTSAPSQMYSAYIKVFGTTVASAGQNLTYTYDTAAYPETDITVTFTIANKGSATKVDITETA